MQNETNATEPTLAERIAIRVAELNAKARLTNRERDELDNLTYAGPVPRVVPFSDEAPF